MLFVNELVQQASTFVGCSQYKFYNKWTFHNIYALDAFPFRSFIPFPLVAFPLIVGIIKVPLVLLGSLSILLDNLVTDPGNMLFPSSVSLTSVTVTLTGQSGSCVVTHLCMRGIVVNMTPPTTWQHENTNSGMLAFPVLSRMKPVKYKMLRLQNNVGFMINTGTW